MNQAKEMVGLSNVLITKISKANKQSSLNAGDEEDEDMKTLKSYFFSMGKSRYIDPYPKYFFAFSNHSNSVMKCSKMNSNS